MSIKFERNSLNRISAVVDPSGDRIRYLYDEKGTSFPFLIASQMKLNCITKDSVSLTI